MPVRMSVDPQSLSGLPKQGKKLSDLRPIFRLDLLFIRFSFPQTSGKKKL